MVTKPNLAKQLLGAALGKDLNNTTQRGAGSGRPAGTPHFQPWRGTDRQVAGLWPFAAGGSAPLIGAPLGRSLTSPGTICADPISWFQKGLISAPNLAVLGLNGLGKSTLIRHMLVGQAARGTHALVLGDIKPDYVDLVHALGGQVIDIGHGKSRINPLDPGAAKEAATRLTGRPREAVLTAAHTRAVTIMSTLIQIVRKDKVTDRETTILDEALRILDTRDQTPVLDDLLQLLRTPTPGLRDAALDRGDLTRYQATIEPLEASIVALMRGRFGGIFSGHTSVQMKMDRSVVFDLSSLRDEPDDVQGAALLTCWSYGFASVEAWQVLADEGLTPRSQYQVVLDELWRVLRLGEGLVDKVDQVTRLNRSIGVGLTILTHSMTDTQALANEADRLKADGFIERSKLIMLGGLPRKEMDRLTRVVSMTEAEQSLLESWNAGATYDPTSGRQTRPPGQGKFLLKAGSDAGWPFEVQLTQPEIALSNTNARWNKEPTR